MKRETGTYLTGLLAAALALALAVVGPSRSQMMEGVAAIVNDDVITTYDVEQRMRLLLASSNVQPTQELMQRIQAEAIRSLIDERLQLQEAAEYEIAVTDEDVAQELDNLAARNNASAAAIEQDLARRGVDIDTLEQQLRAELAWQILVNGRFRPLVRVSDNQIDQALERMATNADKPSYRIAEILIEPRSQSEAQQALQFIAQQLNQGVPFQQLAQQISRAPSAVDGGEVGWVRAGELRNEEIERALEGMNPGDIRPVETREGIYFMLLLDRRRGVELERLELNQIFVPYGANAGDGAFEQASQQLTRGTRRVRNCEDIQEAAERIDGAIFQDLGLLPPSDLNAELRDKVINLNVGQITEPISLPSGAAIVMLCSRQDMATDAMPSREDIENRLLDQQLALYSRRYLRSLLDQATIETRTQ